MRRSRKQKERGAARLALAAALAAAVLAGALASGCCPAARRSPAYRPYYGYVLLLPRGQ